MKLLWKNYSKNMSIDQILKITYCSQILFGALPQIFSTPKMLKVFSFNFDKSCLILNKLIHFLVLIQNRFIPSGSVAELGAAIFSWSRNFH